MTTVNNIESSLNVSLESLKGAPASGTSLASSDLRKLSEEQAAGLYKELRDRIDLSDEAKSKLSLGDILKNIDDSLISVRQTEQANAWKFKVENNVHNHHRNDREGQRMQPTSGVSSGHSISSQQRTQEPQGKQKPINDIGRMVLQCNCANSTDVDHGIHGWKQ